MDTASTQTKQTMGFQAQVNQLLQLMIHSLYSNKEIFLRELVSNASDACDKLRFEGNLNAALLENGGGELAIQIAVDPQARTITISDNGIGMTRQDAIDNLGTIARSGTKEFFSRLSGDQQQDAQLIGQFGVGFYSSFIVAKHVAVITRHAGAQEAWRWESEGTGEFSIEPAERATRGTDIILTLRDDQDDLLEANRIRGIVRKYSDHISLPIQMRKQVWNAENSTYDTTDELESINQASALWTRNKSDITDEQYKEFYKHIGMDWEDPLAWTHNRVEGRSQYTQLLFVPKRAPFDLWDRNQRSGIKLYVRRVFIMDDAEQLLPPYLRFVRGVIDSADLPLNVSREILQESRDVKAIREGCTKRVLSILEDMAENRTEDYATFWKEFGAVLKEGTGDDANNREKIAGLLRFASTHTDSAEQTVSLKDYASRFKDGQDKIYYVTAEGYDAARHSPHLEVFRKKGIEVLLLTDRVDEWMLSYLHEFEGKSLVSVAKGDLDIGTLQDEAEQQAAEQMATEYKELVERLQTALGGRVKEVRVTTRLVESAACVVSDDNQMSQHLQRMLKAAGQAAPTGAPILEINPQHALVQRMAKADAQFDEWALLLFEQAQLAEGATLQDPGSFVRRMNQLLLS